MVPASGATTPESTAMSVLFPAPFWPTRAQTSPPATEKSTPSRATVPPKDLRTPRISRRGGVLRA